MTENQEEIFAVGVGQIKTGTSSLKSALEILYRKKCYSIFDIILNHHEHVDPWIVILESGHLDQASAEILFEGYNCIVDSPAALFYEDLMVLYPNCKFVLTSKDSTEWLDQVRKMTSVEPLGFSNGFQINIYAIFLSHFKKLIEKIYQRAFQESLESLTKNDEILKTSYEKFNERVRCNIPKERLLELNVNEGWEPLCKFLNLPIPDLPFPRVSAMERFAEHFKTFIKETLTKYGQFYLLFIVYVVVIFKLATILLW